MRLVPALLLVAGLGCDSVFGLDHIDPRTDGRTAGPDLPATFVSGRRTWHVVTNDAQRRPRLSEAPYPGQWTVVLDDGSLPPVTVHDDGTFMFERATATQAYRLFPADHSFEVQHTSATVELAPTYYGRFDRDPVPAGTTLTYSVPNATSLPGTAYVNTTGLWTSTGAPNVSAFTLDWTKQGALYGAPGLLRVDKNDRAFYILDQLDAAGYTATVGYRADDISIPAGGAPVIAGNFTAVNRDSCIRVVANNGNVVTRLTAAGMTGTKVGNWLVRSMPLASNGPFIGFIVASAPTITNTDTNVFVGNPYPGHDLMLSQSVFSTRTFTAPGATSAVTLYEGTQYYVVPATSCAQASVLDSVAPIPTSLMLDGVPIAADGQTVVVPRPGEVVVSFAADGVPDRYRLDLYEVSRSASGSTNVRLVTQLYSQTPRIQLDSALLVAGMSYTLLAAAEVGTPNAATGDMTTIAYPYGQSFQFSKMITIAN